MGMMWAENGYVKSFKTLDQLHIFYTLYNQLREKGKNIVLHFRRATKGDVCLENCHPFYINKELAMVHNGTISIPDLPDGKCDTVEFRDRILRKLPTYWIDDPDFRDMVNEYTGWSRIVFMRADGAVYLINAARGEWDETYDSWFSNKSYRRHYRTNRSSSSNGYWNGWTDDDDDENEDDTETGSNKSDTNSRDASSDDGEKQAVKVSGDRFCSGYVIEGNPICEKCIPKNRIGDPDVTDINDLYESGEIKMYQHCEACHHPIFPGQYIDHVKGRV